jgi:hypothetical protein
MEVQNISDDESEQNENNVVESSDSSEKLSINNKKRKW